MYKFKFFIVLVLSAGIFFSCATSYKPVVPTNTNYQLEQTNPLLAYRYGVLLEAKNKAMAKREDKTKVRVVAVRIMNNTGKTLKYGYNYKFYTGEQEIFLLPIAEITKYVKQDAPVYLAYLVLTWMRVSVINGYNQTNIPAGLILGPGLSLLNYNTAQKANRNFKMELEMFNIADKEIKAGETEYGLIGIKNTATPPLSIKLLNN